LKLLKARENNFSSKKSAGMLYVEFEKLLAYIGIETISKRFEK